MPRSHEVKASGAGNGCGRSLNLKIFRQQLTETMFLQNDTLLQIGICSFTRHKTIKQRFGVAPYAARLVKFQLMYHT